MECYASLIIALSAATCFSSTTFNASVTSPTPSLISLTSSRGEEVVVRFEKEPEDVIAVRDQPITMDCLLRSSSSPSSSSLSTSSRYSEEAHVTWLKDGLPVQLDDKSRWMLLPNGSLHRRNVDDLQFRMDSDDVGGYQCLVEVDAGAAAIVSRVATLRLSYMDKSWSEEPQPSLLGIGDSMILGCRVSAQPKVKVKWFKDDQEIETGKTNSARKYFIHTDGALEIAEVMKSHFGRYKCKVRNESDKKWKTSRTASLDEENELDANMDSPPRFFYKPRDVSVTEGTEDLLLHCGANGKDRNGAPVTIRWLKDGDIIDFTRADARRRLVGRGSLRVARVAVGDAGHYTCRASNSEDVVETTAYVTVTFPPRFVDELESSESEGDSDVEMSCKVVGNPRPTVEWLKNGRPLVEELGAIKFYNNNNRNNINIISNNNNNDYDFYKMKIFGSHPNDTGIYQCLATNEVGSAQISAMVIFSEGADEVDYSLQDDPHFHVRPLKVEGRSVTLSREPRDAMGVSVLIRWREVTSSRTRSLKTSDDVVVLTDLLPSKKYLISVVVSSAEGRRATRLEVRTADEDEAVKVISVIKNLRANAVSSRSILLTWTTPSSSPSRTTSLVYRVEDSNATEVRLDLPSEVGSIRVDRLRPHSSYRFTLGEDDDGQIKTSSSSSSSSGEVLCRTYSERPGSPPQNVNVEEREHDKILMTWEEPKEANGPITGYKIKYKMKSSRSSLVTVATDSKQRRLELSGFNNGQEMVFRIQALNVNGSGPFSPWVSIKSSTKRLDESVVPGQPSSLNVRSFGSSVFVTWSPPEDRSVAVQGYVLSYGVGVPEVFRQMFDAKHRQYTVKNLKPSSEYVISLKAFNGAGEGEPVYNSVVTGELNSFVAQLPLIPPVGLKATVVSSTSILLSWSDASLSSKSFNGMQDFAAFANERGVKDRLYTVRYNLKASKKFKFINTTQPSIIINDLRPDTEYEFTVKVRLKNNRASTWSLSVFNRTKEAAPSTAPRDLTPLVMEGHSHSVILNWQPPKTPNGQVTGYLIHYTTNVSHDEKDWVTEGVLGERLTATVGGLTPETTYYFRVRARNGAGEGPSSSIVLLKTPKQQKHHGFVESHGLEERFPHHKFIKVRQSTTTATPPSVPASDEIPQWLFWIVIVSLAAFVLFSVLSLVAVLRCRRLTKLDQRRSQKSKVSTEAQNVAESLLLSPSALSLSARSHRRSVPPDVCRNHVESDPVSKVDVDPSGTISTTKSRRTDRNEEEHGGICGSFYYFPSRISASGSLKGGSNSYNPGWVYPSSLNSKNQLCTGDDEVDQSVVNTQRASENPYFIHSQQLSLF